MWPRLDPLGINHFMGSNQNVRAFRVARWDSRKPVTSEFEILFYRGIFLSSRSTNTYPTVEFCGLSELFEDTCYGHFGVHDAYQMWESDVATTPHHRNATVWGILDFMGNVFKSACLLDCQADGHHNVKHVEAEDNL